MVLPAKIKNHDQNLSKFLNLLKRFVCQTLRNKAAEKLLFQHVNIIYPVGLYDKSMLSASATIMQKN